MHRNNFFCLMNNQLCENLTEFTHYILASSCVMQFYTSLCRNHYIPICSIYFPPFLFSRHHPRQYSKIMTMTHHSFIQFACRKALSVAFLPKAFYRMKEVLYSATSLKFLSIRRFCNRLSVNALMITTFPIILCFNKPVHTFLYDLLYVLTVHFVYFSTHIYYLFPFSNLDCLFFFSSTLRFNSRFGFHVDINDYKVRPKDYIFTSHGVC